MHIHLQQRHTSKYWDNAKLFHTYVAGEKVYVHVTVQLPSALANEKSATYDDPATAN